LAEEETHRRSSAETRTHPGDERGTGEEQQEQGLADHTIIEAPSGEHNPLTPTVAILVQLHV